LHIERKLNHVACTGLTDGAWSADGLSVSDNKIAVGCHGVMVTVLSLFPKAHLVHQEPRIQQNGYAHKSVYLDPLLGVITGHSGIYRLGGSLKAPPVLVK
jgi:hypothetical protein